MDIDYRPEQSAGYLTNWAARLFTRALERRFKGGAAGTMPVFFALVDSRQQTQTELAQWSAVEQPTMANTLARMDRDGLISRSPDPADRRSTLIGLTPLGQQRAREALTAAMQTNEFGLSALQPGEREAFLDMLRRVVAALRADEG